MFKSICISISVSIYLYVSIDVYIGAPGTAWSCRRGTPCTPQGPPRPKSSCRSTPLPTTQYSLPFSPAPLQILKPAAVVRSGSRQGRRSLVPRVLTRYSMVLTGYSRVPTERSGQAQERREYSHGTRRWAAAPSRACATNWWRAGRALGARAQPDAAGALTRYSEYSPGVLGVLTVGCPWGTRPT